jgi:GTP-binding protein YchF
MSVSCGIVGLPRVGKTTLFNALTAAQAEAGGFSASKEPNVAMLEVPDPNLERIASFIPTKKLVPATVKIVDIVGLPEGASRGEGVGNRFLAHIRETDAILHVVQCFSGPNVMREGPIDAKHDIEVLELELAMADLETLSRALDRVAKKAKSGAKEALLEREVAERAKDALERGESLRAMDWKKPGLEVLRTLCLLSMKPVLYVANVGDDDLKGEGREVAAVARRAEETGSRWLALCSDLECEHVDACPRRTARPSCPSTARGLALPRPARGLHAPRPADLLHRARREVRAWTVHAGDTAPVAAGKIHTDFQKASSAWRSIPSRTLVAQRTEAAHTFRRQDAHGRPRLRHAEDDVCHFLVGKQGAELPAGLAPGKPFQGDRRRAGTFRRAGDAPGSAGLRSCGEQGLPTPSPAAYPERTGLFQNLPGRGFVATPGRARAVRACTSFLSRNLQPHEPAFLAHRPGERLRDTLRRCSDRSVPHLLE